jgi:hypothetical protein
LAGGKLTEPTLVILLYARTSPFNLIDCESSVHQSIDPSQHCGVSKRHAMRWIRGTIVEARNHHSLFLVMSRLTYDSWQVLATIEGIYTPSPNTAFSSSFVLLFSQYFA